MGKPLTDSSVLTAIYRASIVIVLPNRNHVKIRICEFSSIVVMAQQTLKGTSRKRKRVSGFRVRMRTRTGQAVIRARRKKGRARLAV